MCNVDTHVCTWYVPGNVLDLVSEVVSAAVQLQRAVPSHEPSRSPSSPSLVRRRERVF